MWKAALVGALAAVLVLTTILAIGCTTIFGPAICRIDRRATPISISTIKNPERRAYYVRNGVPSIYRTARNPFRRTIGNVVEGARLYDLRCAMCHGVMGVGDGAAGERLSSPPADLGASLTDPIHGDDFFFWTISDGGRAFGTDMPGFRGDLSDAEIWKIVTFMRAAFAEDGNAPEQPPAP